MGFFEAFNTEGILGRKKRKTKSFFVNSYGNAQTRGIYTFQIDVETGELVFRKHFITPTNPTYSFNYGRFVCTTFQNRTGTAGDGGICSYTSTSETLALVSRISDYGKTYVHACTNGDDVVADKIIAVDYYNGEIMVGVIKKKKLSYVASVYGLEGSSVHPTRQMAPHPCYVGFTPDHVLYVVDLGTDTILFFDIDKENTLQLREKETLFLPAGSGPRKLLFNQSGTIAYVLNELNSTITVYTYKNKQFIHLQTVDTYDKENYNDTQNIASQFVISEDEKYLFVTNKGHDTISAFRINAESGEIAYCDFVDTSFGPVDLLVFKNRWIVVACQKGGNIEVIEYNTDKKGRLRIEETDFSYLVSEPISMTTFIDITQRNE